MVPLVKPSDADRWVRCYASVALSAFAQRFEDNEDARREGEAAHWVASYRGGTPPVEGDTAPNGYMVDADMVKHAAGWRELTGWVPDENIETEVDLSFLGLPTPGVVDAWGVSDGRLEVYEYKYGFGLVDAHDNFQLIMYALALLEKLASEGVEVHTVGWHVHQPRSYQSDGTRSSPPIRLSDGEMLQHRVRIGRAVAAIVTGSTEATPGRHCRNCPGRYGCSALRKATLDIIDHVKSASIEELPNESVGSEMVAIQHATDLLKARWTGLEQQTIFKIKRGESVPGWTLTQGTSAFRWNLPADQVRAIAKAKGVNVDKPQELITPTQAIAAGLPSGLVWGSMAKRDSTGLKLKPTNTAKLLKELRK